MLVWVPKSNEWDERGFEDGRLEGGIHLSLENADGGYTFPADASPNVHLGGMFWPEEKKRLLLLSR